MTHRTIPLFPVLFARAGVVAAAGTVARALCVAAFDIIKVDFSVIKFINLFYKPLANLVILLHINLHSAAKASAQIEMKADGWRRNLIFILYTIYEERQTTTHVEVSRRGTSC